MLQQGWTSVVYAGNVNLIVNYSKLISGNFPFNTTTNYLELSPSLHHFKSYLSLINVYPHLNQSNALTSDKALEDKSKGLWFASTWVQAEET